MNYRKLQKISFLWASVQNRSEIRCSVRIYNSARRVYHLTPWGYWRCRKLIFEKSLLK